METHKTTQKKRGVEKAKGFCVVDNVCKLNEYLISIKDPLQSLGSLCRTKLASLYFFFFSPSLQPLLEHVELETVIARIQEERNYCLIFVIYGDGFF